MWGYVMSLDNLAVDEPQALNHDGYSIIPGTMKSC